MPEIQAFRGLRYNLARVGSLSECIAPPYDVIDSVLQNQLYELSPYNFVRLELPKSDPADSVQALYDRAGRTLRGWQSEKILQAEPDPAIYVYHQQFQWLGQSFLRRGLMANVRLERFGQGKIYPHEHTHARAKEDRLEMLRTCRANLSQIFGLYQDPENQIQELLESKILGVLGTEAIDHLGVRHSIWPISDLTTIQEISSMISSLPMFVADGHHRYETACNYRDELAAAGKLKQDDPANFVLTALVSMSDPGLIVLPTHRLLHGIPRLSTEQLREKLDKYFDCELVAKGPESAGAVWAELDRLELFLDVVLDHHRQPAHGTVSLPGRLGPRSSVDISDGRVECAPALGSSRVSAFEGSASRIDARRQAGLPFARTRRVLAHSPLGPAPASSCHGVLRISTCVNRPASPLGDVLRGTVVPLWTGAVPVDGQR